MNNKCCFRLFAGSSCPLIRTSNWILNLIYSTKEKSLAGRNELNWHLHKNDFFQLMVVADVPTGEYIIEFICQPIVIHIDACLCLASLRSTTNNCVTSERTSSVCSRRTLTDWDSCHHLSTTTVPCSKRLSFLFFHPSFKPSPWRMPLLLQETSGAGVHSRRPTQRQRWTKNRLPELEIYCCGCVAISLKARTGTIK